MERIPAVAGWHWIKHGFALFRRQPGELSTLFIMYCGLNLLLSVAQELAVILWFTLIPVFSMAFMTACRDIERDQRVHPRLLFAGFRNPAFKRLLLLGACYLAAMIIAVLVANFSDDGYLFKAILDQVNNPPAADAKVPEDLRLVKSLLVLAGFYLASILPLFFATPLIAWQNMSVGKAIFFSFFTVVRAIKAFAVYGVCWFLITVIGRLVIGAVLELLGADNAELGLFFLMPLSLVLTLVMNCSHYACYTQIFGSPELPEPSEKLPD
ncbi:MAG TPA: BPSS1780 family membrane protein [Burkholderiaceae bacterium]|jgi:hypothetical protein|nr:BPSS1780 family membrane protein [Burkholderiaceae bacterium]